MRTLFHDSEAKQINILDNRYYTNDGLSYYPGSTTVLDAYPKGEAFNEWLKQVGGNAKQIVEAAAEQGSKIHEATEHLNLGNPVMWADEQGNTNYTLKEWKMLLKYKEFWDKCEPKIIANEKSMCSDKLGYGGTLDRVVMIGSKRWLLDIKTSNYLHKTHELQLASYAILWNEINPEQPIEETGIIWLNASTRTAKIDFEKNIFQGVGWQIKTYERHYMDAYKIFVHCLAIWKEENPNYKPLNLIYPDTITL